MSDEKTKEFIKKATKVHGSNNRTRKRYMLKHVRSYYYMS